MSKPECPFCGADPFHYVDIGVGTEAVAVVCCDLGDLYFRGAREPITGDVVIDADTFREIGNRLSTRQHALSAERARVIELAEALEFYADPETYLAIAFVPDPPCGEFMDDFSDDHDLEDERPGKRARAALLKASPGGTKDAG